VPRTIPSDAPSLPLHTSTPVLCNTVTCSFSYFCIVGSARPLFRLTPYILPLTLVPPPVPTNFWLVSFHRHFFMDSCVHASLLFHSFPLGLSFLARPSFHLVLHERGSRPRDRLYPFPPPQCLRCSPQAIDSRLKWTGIPVVFFASARLPPCPVLSPPSSTDLDPFSSAAIPLRYFVRGGTLALCFPLDSRPPINHLVRYVCD